MKTDKVVKTIAIVIMILAFPVLSVGNAMHIQAKGITITGKKYGIDHTRNRDNSLFTDSSNGVFYYSIYTNFTNGEYTVTKHYVDGNSPKKIVLSMKNKEGSLYYEERYVWNDRENDGIFYVYADDSYSDEYSDCYLVYDDVSGKNVFKIEIKKLLPAIKKCNIKNDGIINTVARVNDKVMIMLAGTTIDKKHTAYAYLIYDLNSQKITDSNVIRKNNGEFYASARIGDCQFDDKYIYMPYTSGKIKKNDTRKQKLLIYDYSGKLVNKINYTKTILRLKKPMHAPRKAKLLHYCVKDGYIYVLSGKGIYKCSSLQKKPAKIWNVESSSPDIKKLTKRISGFAYTGNGKFFVVNTISWNHYLYTIDTK